MCNAKQFGDPIFDARAHIQLGALHETQTMQTSNAKNVQSYTFTPATMKAVSRNAAAAKVKLLAMLITITDVILAVTKTIILLVVFVVLPSSLLTIFSPIALAARTVFNFKSSSNGMEKFV
mmetsp:Transcript_7033/g.10538  ORF Transcript_7033/g.10538 Transcript_7033/m.10538 type:complete len:121 (-) Transcript_7033:876-1238(-)